MAAGTNARVLYRFPNQLFSRTCLNLVSLLFHVVPNCNWLKSGKYEQEPREGTISNTTKR